LSPSSYIGKFVNPLLSLPAGGGGREYQPISIREEYENRNKKKEIKIDRRRRKMKGERWK
jgi:hypothetical protein